MIPGPVPPSFQVNVPNELATTLMGNVALVWLLNETVIVPLLTPLELLVVVGVLEGITALICVAETNSRYAGTGALLPTVTLTEVPMIVVGSGVVADGKGDTPAESQMQFT